MNNFKKIIFIVFILLFLNLLIGKSIFITTILFFLLNLYLSIFTKKNSKYIRRIIILEIILWTINSYWVLVNDINSWFLALNNLLWLLTSIKLIEVKNNINIKNIVILLILSFGTSTLFNVNSLSNLVVIISFFLLFYSLLIFNKYKPKNLIKQIIILLLILPLSLISFVNIPLPKPWIRINSKALAQTGINDELMPGNISNLAKSNDLVGRIYFKGDIPKPENRYWRVIVLDHFVNNKWATNKKFKPNNFAIQSKLLDNNSEVNNFEKWILEPSQIKQRPWSGNGYVFGSNLAISNRGVLLGTKKLDSRVEYKISPSYSSWKQVSPNIQNKTNNEIKNKLLYKLSRKWLRESNNPEEIVERAKDWFSKENFTYSINPGLMNKNAPYDDFLFMKKKGFCEHFAGSFALLMKYAEIPARIVVGYQGGKIYSDSKDKKFILVDNSYAHAWNEIWLEDKGWIKIDPTFWVAPERILDSSLIEINDKSTFINYRRFLNLKFISIISKLEFFFKDIFKIVSSKLTIFQFSKNIILNRIYSILFFLLILLISILCFFIFEFKIKNKPIRFFLNIYFYLLNLFSIKMEKGETLKSFSSRIYILYPEIKKEVKEIYRSYYLYKFMNEKYKLFDLLSLSLKLSFNEFKVLKFLFFKKINLCFYKLFKRN